MWSTRAQSKSNIFFLNFIIVIFLITIKRVSSCMGKNNICYGWLVVKFSCSTPTERVLGNDTL